MTKPTAISNINENKVNEKQASLFLVMIKVITGMVYFIFLYNDLKKKCFGAYKFQQSSCWTKRVFETMCLKSMHTYSRTISLKTEDK